MKFLQLRFFVVLVVLCFARYSHAASGLVSWTGAGTAFAVASSSCADIKAAALSSVITDLTCSADPVVIGTTVYVTAYGNVYPNPVTELTATPSVAPPPASTASDQTSINTADIQTLKTQLATLESTVGTNGIDPKAIAASSVLFAAFLAALAVLWGAKTLLSLFRTHSGED